MTKPERRRKYVNIEKSWDDEVNVPVLMQEVRPTDPADLDKLIAAARELAEWSSEYSSVDLHVAMERLRKALEPKQ